MNKLERWDKAYIWHPFTQHSTWSKERTTIISSAKGPFLYDTRGKRYLDSVSSLWVNIHGHRHPVLDRAVRRQLSKVAHSTFLGLSHEPAIRLARELAKLAPTPLVRTFFSDNGATAVEVALKIAFQFWLEKGESRPEFLALKGSYHGDTIGSVSVGGIGAFHSKFKPLLFKTNFAMRPSCYRCPFNKTKSGHRFRLGEKVALVPRPGELRAETGCRWQCLQSVADVIKKRGSKIAAAVAEPIFQGASGINVMPPGYLAGLGRLCRKANILFMIDEVASGFGRTGTLFASEQESVKPDLMAVAKGLTGGYSPLAATLTSNRIFNAFIGPVQRGRTFFHGHSYTAHPLGAAVAVANLNLIRRSKLLEKSRRKAHLMKDELRSLGGLLHVGSVRQTGLVAGVELVKDKNTQRPYPAHWRMGARICRRLLARGIWSRPLGDVIVIMPPLTISDALLRRLIREVRKAILYECET